MQLIAEKPETEVVVKEKLTALHHLWEDLESTTQAKAQRLFDANKAELFTQSCADLDKWVHNLEGQLQSDDYGKDLTSVSILLKKQQVCYYDGATIHKEAWLTADHITRLETHCSLRTTCRLIFFHRS